MAEQSRRMSLVESVANVAIGYGIAFAHATGGVSGLWCYRLAGAKRRHRGDFHGREHCPQLLPALRVRADAREGKP